MPDAIRGRIFAFDPALITLTLGASSWIAGNAAERFGPRPTAFVLGGLALGWAAVWWTATRRVRRLPLVATPAEPGPASGPEPGTRGPNRRAEPAGQDGAGGAGS